MATRRRLRMTARCALRLVPRSGADRRKPGCAHPRVAGSVLRRSKRQLCRAAARRHAASALQATRCHARAVDTGRLPAELVAPGAVLRLGRHARPTRLAQPHQSRPGQPQPPQPNRLWLDDAAAVVQRGDVSEAWLKRTEEFCSENGFGSSSGGGGNGPKFSHAWVVGGSAHHHRRSGAGERPTNTGAQSVAVDGIPRLWQDHQCAGVGVPGSPGLLIGFNRRVAWGLTALGADQSDLFRLDTDPTRPDEYRCDGQWRKMGNRTERIRVKGGREVQLTCEKHTWARWCRSSVSVSRATQKWH